MEDRSEFERLVQLHDDERLIIRRLHTYSHTIDAPNREGWLDCFTHDGTFRASGTGPGQPEFKVTGRDALTTFIIKHGRRPEGLHLQHLMFQPLVDVNGDTATCRAYFLVLSGESGGPTVVRMFGHYADRLLRCPDGEWRFVERAAHTEAMHADAPRL